LIQTNVLFIWKVRDELQDYLNSHLGEHENINLIFLEDEELEKLDEYAVDADIIIGWRPKQEMLDKAERLKLFINPGVGVQHLIEMFKELNHDREQPIILANGHGNTYFTAEHAVALLLSYSNRIVLHDRWMRDGLWRKGDKEAASIPIKNKNIGLLGYGAINKKVHQFLSGYDVEFSILRNNWSKDTDYKYPTTYSKYNSDQLDQFLSAVDILMIALPQTSRTINLIGQKEFKMMKENLILITVARGTVINQEAFYDALSSNKIRGAAIDVWYNYTPDEVDGKKFPFDFPFHELDNVIMSPHRAASPFSDLDRWYEVVDNILICAQGSNRFINQVNLDEEY
jgi:phosphoglycerate dehydrogenase-like enzyme